MRSKAIVFFFVMVALLITWGGFYFPGQPAPRMANDPLTKIVIVGSKKDASAEKLYSMAVSLSVKNAEIVWWDRKEGPLKNSLIQYPELDEAAVYVCQGQECSLPLFQSEELIEFIDHLDKKQIKSTVKQLTMTERLLQSESWILTVIGFIGVGLLLSFSPCILPLIPIMASIIVGQTIGVRKSRTFLLCLAYVLSMAFTYALLGLLAGMFGWYLQVYMQRTWIVISFSMIFFMLSLSMLGAYELKMPHKYLNKLHHHSNQQQGGSFIGVMGMGVLATLIVSPCVTAPLAAILSYITHGSDYVLGAVSLFFMGVGMGVPLLIISLFSNNILPKLTHWYVPIKNFFGLVLMGMSIWMVSRVIPQGFSDYLWSALIILISIYMGLYKKRTAKLSAKMWKTLTIMVFLSGVAMFFNAAIINSYMYKILTQHTFSPAVEENIKVDDLFHTIESLTELDDYRQTARSTGTPVLLDFTAKWCVACVKMENEVFVDPVVQSQLNKFMLLRVDLTDADAGSMNIAKKFQVVGPPAIIFFGLDGELMSVSAMGEYNVAEFLKVLNTALIAKQ